MNTKNIVLNKRSISLLSVISFAVASLLMMSTVVSTGSAGAASSTKQVTIGFAEITEASPVVLQAQAEAKAVAKLLGFKLIVANADGDPAQMAAGMSSFVNQGVSALFDIAIAPAVAPQAFASAKKKGIPIIAILGPVIDPTHQVAATYGPSDAIMGHLLAKQMMTDYPSGAQALTLNASRQMPIVIRYQTLAHDTAGVVNVASVHETDLGNAIVDTQTAVADSLQANPKINMIWGLQDWEFATSLQTIASKKLQNCGVYGFYLDPIDFSVLRTAKAAGITSGMAVVDSPVWDSVWYAFDAIANKNLLHKSKWITAQSIHEFPYVLLTPTNVQATGDVYKYPSYKPFFTSLWKSEGIKVVGK